MTLLPFKRPVEPPRARPRQEQTAPALISGGDRRNSNRPQFEIFNKAAVSQAEPVVITNSFLGNDYITFI